MKQAIPLYLELKHPNLIELENYFETQNGYVAIFKWFNGENLHSHWLFNSFEKHNNPQSPYYKYKKVSIQKRLKSLDGIFSFHTYVESKGYVAIDFYDGSILYDFINDITKICDIDFYKRKPVVNDRGEDFWGSNRFKSPEEYKLASIIDEKTNVYNMGAIAFGLLGGECDHSIEKWEAGDELYSIACKVTEKDRNRRYCCVCDFYKEWKKAATKIILKLL